MPASVLPEVRYTMKSSLAYDVIAARYKFCETTLDGSHLCIKPILWELNYFMIERFSNDLKMKKREQNRKNKRTKIEQFHWFIERIQTCVAFGLERSGEKNF